MTAGTTAGARSARRLGLGLTGVLVTGPLLAVSAAGAAGAQASAPVPDCFAGECSVIILETGSPVDWMVPPGVTSATFKLFGAAGEGTTAVGGTIPGGGGAEVIATIPVNPGDSYTVTVGGAGGDNGTGDGGYNGGGDGNSATIGGGGGGGSTDVTLAGAPVLVAGGGGGAGGPSGDDPSVSGGNGGASASMGANGGTVTGSGGGFADGGGGGGAGTLAAGGAGGLAGFGTAGSGGNGQPGEAGQGGYFGLGGYHAGEGGGGGGGYNGGGGGGGGGFATDANGNLYDGGGGGGGGGSDYVTPSATSQTVTDGAYGGDGDAKITYPDPIATGAPSYSGPANQTLAVPASGGLLSAMAGTSGPANDPLTASGPPNGFSAEGGTVTVNPDGSFSYTPPPGYTGSDSFDYTVSDTSGDYATGTATITVQHPAAKSDVAASLSCPATLMVGGTGPCTLTVTDNGPAAVTHFSAAIGLPAGLVKVSCTSPCARNGNTYTWNRTGLPDGSSEAFTLTVKAKRAGTYAIAGQARSTHVDPDPGNNFTTASLKVTRS